MQTTDELKEQLQNQINSFFKNYQPPIDVINKMNQKNKQSQNISDEKKKQVYSDYERASLVSHQEIDSINLEMYYPKMKAPRRINNMDDIEPTLFNKHTLGVSIEQMYDEFLNEDNINNNMSR